MAQDILNQTVRYSQEREIYNDNMEGKYTKDKHILEILSGKRKDQKYEMNITH